MIRVLLADDHHVVRKGLALLLTSYNQFEIVGEATNGHQAIQLTEALKPDVILMDLNMPDMDGIEATRRISNTYPDSKIMILTSFSDQDHVIPALEAGASGYQLKESDPDELIIAITKMINGEKPFHSKVTGELLAAALHQKNGTGPFDALTKREKDVLREITNGKSNKEIAVDLFITEKTVKTHVSNILAKLELQDRTQAALYALRNGMK